MAWLPLVTHSTAWGLSGKGVGTGKAPDQEVGRVLSWLYKWSKEWVFDPGSEGLEHREGSCLWLLAVQGVGPAASCFVGVQNADADVLTDG